MDTFVVWDTKKKSEYPETNKFSRSSIYLISLGWHDRSYAKNGVKVEVLDTLDRLKEVLFMIHEGMGHQAVGRFSSKDVNGRHVIACKVCQQFSHRQPD